MRSASALTTTALYLRAHAIRSSATLFAIALLADLTLGTQTVDFPSVRPGGSLSFPLEHEVALIIAVLVGQSFSSHMGSFEEAGAIGFQHYRTRHLLSACLLALATSAAIFGIAGNALAAQHLRAMLGDIGIALVSGRLFGWGLSWILPACSIFPMTYLAQDTTGHHLPWDWAGRPPYDPESWGIAILVSTIGVVSFFRDRRVRVLTGRASR
ncbi:hypothetical protein AB0L75_40275 [Streptomyces sp. NPDC052101]|uniref:hypothetical protein n=1 Tax=Streptomyces sp. NPDC052101 TaxID=3155763 RepID=UPI00343EBEDE